MVGYLQPLDEKFPIVGPDGKPTLYFIRWAQQKQIDIGEARSGDQVQALIDQFMEEHQLQAGSGIILTPDGNLLNSPEISADTQEILDQIETTQGSVLFRGSSGWEALPPGTATQYLKSGGPAANPVWQTPSGGGGGGKIYGGLMPPNTTSSSSAFATKGSCIVPMKDFSVTEAIWQLNTVASGVYVARVLQMNAAGTSVSSVLGTSTGFTAASAVTAANILFSFSTPISLAAGNTYAIVVSRTDSTDTYALPLYGASPSETIMLGFPASAGLGVTIAKASPSSGDLNTAATRTPFNMRIGGTNT